MSIKNIYSEICSFDTLLRAERNVRNGKRYGRKELSFWANLEENIYRISESIKSLDFPPDCYTSFYVYEPKLRKIVSADYTTKIIQRAAYDVINPLVCKGFISDTYACIKGRGQLNAMKRLASWVDYVHESGDTWYYLKMDIEKFFYRIDHEILMKIIRKKISDKKALRLMEHYICEASSPFGLPLGVTNPMDIPEEDMLWDVGITIGGGLSHMYGNMYLDPADQLAKRELGIQKYIRLMDDSVILHRDKEKLHQYKKEFSDFFGDVLHLRLNGKTAIRPINQVMELVGYRIWPHKVRLRKSTSLRMKRRLKRVQDDYRDYRLSFEKANDTVMSYAALMKHCDCEALKKKIFDNFVLTHNPKEVITKNGR